MSIEIVEFKINQYLERENPICREERQYALFLYNGLKNNEKDLLKELKIDGEIVHVFFEATLMRDYWYANKVQFNAMLSEYIQRKSGQQYENRKRETRHVNFWDEKYPVARWMMNAKPDIAFVNRIGQKFYLNFIECKYHSRIATYKDSDNKMKQQEIQECILDFLCHYLKMKIEILDEGDKILEKGKVLVVRFFKGTDYERNIHDKDSLKIDIGNIIR